MSILAGMKWGSEAARRKRSRRVQGAELKWGASTATLRGPRVLKPLMSTICPLGHGCCLNTIWGPLEDCSYCAPVGRHIKNGHVHFSTLAGPVGQKKLHFCKNVRAVFISIAWPLLFSFERISTRPSVSSLSHLLKLLWHVVKPECHSVASIAPNAYRAPARQRLWFF